MLLRWAFREIFRSWRISLFFILNLSLGLTGFIALESYKNALQTQIRENRLEILGGDLAVSARRELTPAEEEQVTSALAGADKTTLYDFFAMVGTEQGSRLVLVKAVEPNYPLYGDLEDANGQPIEIDPGGIWISPEVEQQLGLKAQDQLRLGNLNLEVKGLVKKDSTQTFRSASIAPRVYISSSLLEESGLIQFGSTFTKVMLFKLPEGQNPDLIQEGLLNQIEDVAIRVETAEEEGESTGRQLQTLSDFLGLVALVALFLAALGAAYIWRLFLQQRTKDVAILRSLGLDGSKAVLLYILEASILGFAALIPAVVTAQILFPILNRVLSTLTPFDLAPFLTVSSVAVGLCLSLGTSLLIALPFLLRLREIRPAQLFSEEKFKADLDLKRPWALLPALLALWALAVLQSKSVYIGSIFTGVLVGVLAILGAGGWLLLRTLAQIKSGPWDLRHGLRSAGRRRVASLSVFLALGLGSLLMNILPQIKVALQKELTIEESSGKLPSLFMFDIQDEQLEPLRAKLQEQKTELVHLSPLIRSRLIKVNGEAFERAVQTDTSFRTREEENEARFRNRGVNLSYRTDLSDSEEIVEGKPIEGVWSFDSTEKPQISVEWRYAGRMGLQIGDVITFDVQGVEVEGQIVNLRKVRWTSFQPNFFVLIQQGVLDDAPKTWIAAVPKVPEETKNALQASIARDLANISMIDVERTVQDVLRVADQMSWSLELMAALSLLTGAVVLYSIARGQAQSRRWELNLLKVLGANPKQVRRYLLAEFAVLAGLSSLLGSVLSLSASTVFLWQLFDGGFAADWGWVFGTSAFVTLLGLIVAERASASVIRESPLSLLRSE